MSAFGSISDVVMSTRGDALGTVWPTHSYCWRTASHNTAAP